MGQETLEEAAERFIQESTYRNLTFEDYIKFGAKWQAERMYSGEEVLDLLNKFSNRKGIIEDEQRTERWFEQSKKK